MFEIQRPISQDNNYKLGFHPKISNYCAGWNGGAPGCMNIQDPNCLICFVMLLMIKLATVCSPSLVVAALIGYL